MQELESLACDDGLLLYLDGTEQVLDAGTKVQTTLLTGESWQEAVPALYSLDAWVSEAALSDRHGRRANGSCPLDLSRLLRLAEAATDQPQVHADIQLVGNTTIKLRLQGTVRRIPWGNKGIEMPKNSGNGRDVMSGHIATGPRTWRVSLEARSIKLKSVSAKVFAAYSYAPLKMCKSGQSRATSRTFQTHPPVLARHNITTHLPKGFAAYSLTATKEALEAAFEESLHVEVWAQDAFQKDCLLGVAEVSLASAFSQPLRRSTRLPSMVHGFRVFDQVCLLGSAEEKLPDIVGEIRILFFVEDLGPASRAVRDSTRSTKAQDIDAAGNASTRPQRELGETLGKDAKVAEHDAEALTALAVEGLEALRSSPAYRIAYSLEVWKQQEEDRSNIRLKELETQLREELEEEYRQHELLRVQTFRQRQTELRELEQRAKKKLADIQQREISISAEASNSAAMNAQAKRKADLAIQACEEALRRQRAETEQALDFEKRKHAQLESRMKDLELETSEIRKRCSELQASLVKESTEATSGTASLSAEEELRGAALPADVQCRLHFKTSSSKLSILWSDIFKGHQGRELY